jgi:hypothetical protein
MYDGAMQAMSVCIVEARRRGRRLSARNPKGAWGLQPISPVFGVDDVHRRSRLLAP